MKVLIISNLYHPFEKGGAERTAEIAARDFVENGHETIVLTAGFIRDGWKIRESQSGVFGEKIIRFFPPNFFSILSIERFATKIFVPLRFLWHIVDLLSPFSYFFVKSLLNQFHPDLIVTHNLKGIGISTGSAVRQFLNSNPNARWVHHLHDVQLIVPSGLLKAVGGFFNDNQIMDFYALYSLICKKMMGSPTTIFSPSNWLFNLHKERGFFKNSNITILPRYEFQENKPHIDSKKRSGFAYIGQLEPHKGIFVLIEAWKKFCKSQHNSSEILHIAGSGSLEYYIKKIAQNEKKIVFHGLLSHDAVHDLLRQVKSVLVPSIVHENAPNVISEAHQNGARVIASKVGGVPEIINADDLLTEPGDADSLLNALLSFKDKNS